MAAAAILDLFELEIAPLDPPSTKTLYRRTEHEVDRITRCRDMAIRVCWGHMEPPFWGKERSYLRICVILDHTYSLFLIMPSLTGVSDGIIRKSDGSFL